MTADFPFVVGLCSVIECGDLIYCYELGDAFTTVTMSVAIAVGSDVEFFASNQGFTGGTFQGDPTCTPTTCQPVPTESKSWGALKNLYR